MSDDTEQPIPPARDEGPAGTADHPGDTDPDHAFLAPTHPTDAELAQREQDRELETGEENPG